VIDQNILHLKAAASDFMQSIISAGAEAPCTLRELSSYVRASVYSKFPSHADIAVGSLLFLRFFCPAIVAPKSFSLTRAAPTKGQIRGLTLIAKILQSLVRLPFLAISFVIVTPA
jgi:neurofibromin 1